MESIVPARGIVLHRGVIVCVRVCVCVCVCARVCVCVRACVRAITLRSQVLVSCFSVPVLSRSEFLKYRCVVYTEAYRRGWKRCHVGHVFAGRSSRQHGRFLPASHLCRWTKFETADVDRKGEMASLFVCSAPQKAYHALYGRQSCCIVPKAVASRCYP